MGSNSLTDKRHVSGAAAELYVAHYFAERGHGILWPLMAQSRYDLVLEERRSGEFCKLQIKKATWSKTGKYEYLQARISGRNKLTNTPYKEGDVDFFVFTDNSRVWLASFAEVGALTSVCLDSSNPNYKPQTKYNAEAWLVK